MTAFIAELPRRRNRRGRWVIAAVRFGELEEIRHDPSRGFGRARHLDMKLRGINVTVFDAQALQVGLGSGAFRRNLDPSRRDVFDLSAVTFHGSELAGQSAQDRILGDLPDVVWTSLEDAIRVVATLERPLTRVVDVTVNRRFGMVWIAAAWTVPRFARTDGG